MQQSIFTHGCLGPLFLRFGQCHMQPTARTQDDPSSCLATYPNQVLQEATIHVVTLYVWMRDNTHVNRGALTTHCKVCQC
jgi:hypothetical protein